MEKKQSVTVNVGDSGGSSGEATPRQSLHQRTEDPAAMGSGGNGQPSSSDFKFGRVLEILHEGYLDISPAGTIWNCNPRLSNWVGVCRDELQGRHVSELLVFATVDLPETWIRSSLDRPTTQRCGLRCCGGRIKSVEVTLAPVNWQGTFSGFFALLREVDGDTSSCEVWRNTCGLSEPLFARIPDLVLSLLKNLPDDVLVLDSDGRVLFTNHVRLEDHPETVLGGRHADCVADDDREVYERACFECLWTGEKREVEVRSVSGRWWQCQFVSLSDYAQEQYLLVLARDISQQKLADEALRDRERRYRLLLRAVTSYTYSAGLVEGRVVAMEHSPGCWATTGYGPDEFTADPDLWIRIVHRKDQDEVRAFIAHLLDGERVFPLEHRIIHREDGVRWVRHTLVPHREAGRLVRYDGVIEDITERKAAETALQVREASLLAAQKVQSRLLPETPRTLAGCDVAGASRPADFTGGDYFDYLSLSDGSTGFVVGDVSGHGLGPALLMVLIHAHVRSLASTVNDLTEIVRRTNRFLVEEDEADIFVTLFIGALDPESRCFRYVNAGHPAGYVLDGGGQVKAELASESLPLGILADTEFPLGEPVPLEPGDLVLLLTDGIPEATSPEGEMFGIQRALQFVQANRNLPATEIIGRLYDAVQQFSGGEKLLDDMTSIVIKVG